MSPKSIGQSISTHDFVVRRATPDDAEAVAQILEASFAGFRDQYSAEAYRATVLNAAEIRMRLDEGPTWVASHGDDLIGTVSAVITGAGLYVRSMAVSPVSQRRGVGRALLRAAHDYAVQNGLVRMYLSTTPFLSAAIRLYDANGFSMCAADPSDLFGTPLLSMSKDF